MLQRRRRLRIPRQGLLGGGDPGRPARVRQERGRSTGGRGRAAPRRRLARPRPPPARPPQKRPSIGKFLFFFQTFLGDFNPQKVPFGRLQGLWE